MQCFASVVLFGTLLALGCADEAGTEGEAGTADAASPADAETVIDSGASDGGASPAGPTLPSTCPDSGVEHVTADLGWSEGDEVRGALMELLSTVEPGDTIVLSHMYQLAEGGVTVPEGVRVRATEGAGFQLTGITDGGPPWIDIGSCSHWHNVTLIDDEERGPEEFVRTNNRTALRATGRDLLFTQLLFDTNTKTQLELRDVTGVRIHSTHFDNGYFTVLIRPQSQDIEITDSLFANSYGDGIKTIGGGGQDIRRVGVRDTVFEDNLRDGIDTTAGWRSTRVERCLFRRNGVSGMDIKNSYTSESDLHPEGSPNSDIAIVDSEFIGHSNGIVLTTNDRIQTMTEQSDAIHLVHDVRVEGCIFERNEGSGRAFLIKDAHSVSWDGLMLLGEVSLHRIYGPDENRTFGGEPVRPPIPMSNFDIEGTNVATGAARSPSNDYPFEAVGPR